MNRRSCPARRHAPFALLTLLALLAPVFPGGRAAALEAAASSFSSPPVGKAVPATSAPAAAATSPALPAVPGLTPDRARQLRTMADRLKVPYPQMLEGVAGLEDLYARRFAEANTRFRTLERTQPASAIGPFGLAMLTQAQMAENLDFRQEARYLQAVKETLRRADEAIARGEAPAWNHFLRACAHGMSSIYSYRKDRIMGAVQEAWSALNDLEAARKLEPTFVDPALGLGLYDYWYSTVVRRYKLFKGVTDKRKEGIRKMELARDQGVFSPTLARLALVFTYVEDRKPKQALIEAEALRARHPDNVLNLILLGQIHTRLRNLELARQYYTRVTQLDPRNYLVYYHLGSLEFRRGGDLEKAKVYLSRFVNEEPDNEYEVSGRLRLGDTYWLLGDRSNAERQWAIALRDAPDSYLAKRRAQGKRPAARQTGASSPKSPGSPPAYGRSTSSGG